MFGPVATRVSFAVLIAMLPARLANAIIILVCVVWAINFLAPFVVTGYTADQQLNLVFMSIVGGALALSRGQHSRSSKDSKDDRSADR